MTVRLEGEEMVVENGISKTEIMERCTYLK